LKERRKNRITLTDEMAIKQHYCYELDARRKLLEVRKKFWSYQFGLIILTLSLVYLSPYLSAN